MMGCRDFNRLRNSLASLLLLAGVVGVQAEVPNFFTVQKGTVPILVTAPHDGTSFIPGIDLRTGEGTQVRDRDTAKLAQAFSDEYFALTGDRPYVAIAHVSRQQIELNRPDGDSAYEDPDAKIYYDFYHDTIRDYVDEIRKVWPDALMLDLHAHGDNGFIMYRGTRNGRGVQNMLRRFGEAALNGPSSVLGRLESIGDSYFLGGEDILVDPDVSLPFSQQTEDPRFNGGFTIRSYGSGLPP